MWLYLLLIPIESDVNYIKLFYILDLMQTAYRISELEKIDALQTTIRTLATSITENESFV